MHVGNALILEFTQKAIWLRQVRMGHDHARVTGDISGQLTKEGKARRGRDRCTRANEDHQAS
jgi:hypothetical protein